MNSTNSEYYSLEKASEVLGLPTAEVNRLREKSQLRAFRDGATWKFRKVDVDNFLAETIRNRGKNNQEDNDTDFDLLGLDDSGAPALTDEASLDDLANELPAEEAMISLDKKVDDFALDDDLLADDGLSLSEDSGALLLDSSDSSSVGLAVAEDAGDGGDGGLELVNDVDDAPPLSPEPDESDDFLELDDDILALADDDMLSDSTSTINIPVEDDFQLTPDAALSFDDSESSSQVIALDEAGMFGEASEDAAGAVPFESPFGAAADMPSFDAGSPGVGFGAAPVGAGAFGAGPSVDFASTGPAFTPQATSTEADYGPGTVVALFFAAFLLVCSGVMVLDLIIHIWSWGEPFVISSTLMNMIAEMAGLK